MFFAMSAQEIIEQIKTLTLEEKAEVVRFVQQLDGESSSQAKTIRYATPEQAKAAGDHVVGQHAAVFRKLSQ
jgi:hypothetical protein